jgi:hypothetical protein
MNHIEVTPAQELGLNKDDVQNMSAQRRDGVVARRPELSLSGMVECDEVYVVAGHKGHPAAVKKILKHRFQELAGPKAAVG